MVFTHLPSAIFLALIPIPNSLSLAIIFALLRACTNSMDVVPRSAFIASVVLPSERTTVMGVINLVKTSSQSLGPMVTGVLAGAHAFWLAFVIAGGMKACYDLGILLFFINHRTEEERRETVENSET